MIIYKENRQSQMMERQVQNVRFYQSEKLSYLNLRLTSGYSLAELEEECSRLNYVATTEDEINAALAAGIRRNDNIRMYSRAARFWAALRRKRTDCHFNLLDLETSSGFENILWFYADIETMVIDSHLTAYELGRAAQSVIDKKNK